LEVKKTRDNGGFWKKRKNGKKRKNTGFPRGQLPSHTRPAKHKTRKSALISRRNRKPYLCGMEKKQDITSSWGPKKNGLEKNGVRPRKQRNPAFSQTKKRGGEKLSRENTEDTSVN